MCWYNCGKKIKGMIVQRIVGGKVDRPERIPMHRRVIWKVEKHE